MYVCVLLQATQKSVRITPVTYQAILTHVLTDVSNQRSGILLGTVENHIISVLAVVPVSSTKAKEAHIDVIAMVDVR